MEALFSFCVLTSVRPVTYLPICLDSLAEQGIVDPLVIDATNIIPRYEERCDVDTDETVIKCGARQQGRDTVAALRYCHRNSASKWIILLEDDMQACPFAIPEVRRILKGVDPGQVRYFRFSKFIRCTAFPRERISDFSAAVLDNLYVYPHDLTLSIVEWSGGARYVHDRNLFHHVGTYSTIEERNNPKFMEQYAGLRGDQCGESL